MTRAALLFAYVVVVVGCGGTQQSAWPAQGACMQAPATVVAAGGAELYRTVDRYFLSFGAGCIDTSALRALLQACNTPATCGQPFAVGDLAKLLQELAGVDREAAQLGNTTLGVYNVQRGAVFEFDHRVNPVTVLDQLGPGMPTVTPGGGGGGTTVPEGATPTSGALPIVPCCPTCGWCDPGGGQPQCPGPPPPPPPPPMSPEERARRLTRLCG